MCQKLVFVKERAKLWKKRLSRGKALLWKGLHRGEASSWNRLLMERVQLSRKGLLVERASSWKHMSKPQKNAQNMQLLEFAYTN